ncbi:nucleoside-diphosphate kinase [Wenyingzhuangia marina]|uniref:Nucleoside diphosphate kinase n=1 Tax=Wenyingzhuangia marina TaxID=1195760 RepID=A0A1M5VDB7_9FLAO|nr:nucleoside-diphosphate kinase [Wenyingzhuangia marina]GGF72807.1 nucleoside diphosphate kinase [Wenyingzhuangia marina]SHH73239.1 nucleoside diphosphate kinase [Wenyingzhuangia marina]
MANNRTFTMIKPDAFAKGNTGAIIQKITNSGFKIVALKLTKLSAEQAGDFYAIHKEKAFYDKLIEFMTSGPIIAAVLEKKNAVDDFRALIGSTNPEEAAEGTIRNLFATNVTFNAIHGSDSDENAAIESAFHFKDDEIIAY